MKKVFLFIVLLISLSEVFGQFSTGNDSAKYVWYRYAYGNRMARYLADSVAGIPKDTAYSKSGIARIGNVLYVGNDTLWSRAGITLNYPYTTNKILNGYGAWFTSNTDSTTEGSTNLFFTNTRARNAISYTNNYANNGSYSAGVINMPLGWVLGGNSNINAGYTFGTINNVSLRFITNGTQKAILDSVGNFGIGKIPTSLYKLDVGGDVSIGNGTGDVNLNFNNDGYNGLHLISNSTTNLSNYSGNFTLTSTSPSKTEMALTSFNGYINVPNFIIGGTGTTSASLGVIGTGTQLRTNYDALNYTDFTTGLTGNLTIAPSGGNLTVSGALSSTYIKFGSGTPEGSVTAPVGSYYSRTDGSTGTSFYIKQSGSGNTGWTAVNLSASGTVNSGSTYQLGYYAGSGTAISPLTLITANRALISNSNGLPIASSVTNTELGYVSGVTSSIQTQLDALNAAVATPFIFHNGGTAVNPDSILVRISSTEAIIKRPLEGEGTDITQTDTSITFRNLLAIGKSGGQTVIGSTSTNSGLSFQTTTGVGTTGADFIWKGGNNGAAEFMRILNSGNVGIATASPATILDINGTTTLRGDVVVSSHDTYDIGATGLRHRSIYAATSMTAPEFYGSTAGGGDVSIQGTSSGTKSGSDVRLQRLGGNVAIGLSAATTTFDVMGTTSAGVQRLMKLKTGTSADGDAPVIEFSTSNTDGYGPQIGGIREATGGLGGFFVRTGTNAQAERFRISDAGNVGIGVYTSLSAKLSVLSTGTQMRKMYDASNYVDEAVGSTGNYSINATGSNTSISLQDPVKLDYTLNASAFGSYFPLSYNTTTKVIEYASPFQLVQFVNETATDANFTISTSMRFTTLPVVTATRTLTLPNVTTYVGTETKIRNMNTSGTYSWSITAGALKDAAGTNVTTLTNGKVYTIHSDGSSWVVQSVQ